MRATDHPIEASKPLQFAFKSPLGWPKASLVRLHLKGQESSIRGKNDHNVTDAFRTHSNPPDLAGVLSPVKDTYLLEVVQDVPLDVFLQPGVDSPKRAVMAMAIRGGRIQCQRLRLLQRLPAWSPSGSASGCFP